MSLVVFGKVVYGKQIARTMGFPTANILHYSDMSGIYSGLLDSRMAILYIHENILEAHILDWSGNLYDKEVEIHIGQKLRNHYNFECLDQVITQIKHDIFIYRIVSSILDSVSNHDKVCLAFSGGKESCILVDLLVRCQIQFDIVHFKPMCYTNTEIEFFDMFLHHYGKTYTTIEYNEFQSAVESLNTRYTVCFLGVRSSDTGKDTYESTWLSQCAVEVPLFRIDYNQVFGIIDYFQIQLNKKYSEGYSSVGYGSVPNKFLKKFDGSGYIHAKYLCNINKERSR